MTSSQKRPCESGLLFIFFLALPSTKEQQRSCTYKNVSWNHGVVWKDDSKILPNDKQCKECSCTVRNISSYKRVAITVSIFQKSG